MLPPQTRSKLKEYGNQNAVPRIQERFSIRKSSKYNLNINLYMIII